MSRGRGGQPGLPESKAIWYLKKTDLFDWLGEDDFSQISRAVKDREVKKGQAVYISGRPEGTIYLLKQGRIKLYRMSGDGHPIILDILESGDLFGEFSPSSDARGETVAEAMEDSYICGWRRETFNLLVKVNPEFALRLVEAMDERRRRFEVRIDELLYKDVPTRLARILIRLGEQFGTVGPEGIRIRMGLTHEDLAALIASTRETLSKFMSEFRTRGLIDYGSGQITLLNLPGLEAQAQYDRMSGQA